MSALVALGHLDAGDPVDIVSQAAHPSADIRHAVAYALGGRADVISVRALTALSSDHDEDVRDWATFGLGSLCDVDTTDVRDALIARLSDENAEVRGEALVGLAMRADRRASPYLIAALKRGETHYLILEASEELIRACPDEIELRDTFAAR
jgi:HEAT repeat protein